MTVAHAIPNLTPELIDAATKIPENIPGCPAPHFPPFDWGKVIQFLKSTTIQGTPEEMMARANQIRVIREQHNEIMDRFRVLITSLNEIWKGEAQDAFVAKYENMQSTFTNFSEILGGFAVLLETAAKQLESADQSMRNAIQNSF